MVDRATLAERIRNVSSPQELGVIVRELVERIEALETRDPNDPPLIDGCRIVHRGDGFDVCKVHYRYWKSGTEMCPGRNQR